MLTKSSIYTGLVSHQRMSPKSHGFSYKVFMMYLNLDELPICLRVLSYGHTSKRILPGLTAKTITAIMIPRSRSLF